MYDLRLCLFYSYIVYSFFLPIVFLFLLLVYKNLSSFLIPIIIIDTILFLTLLVNLYYLLNKEKRLRFYIIVIVIAVFITIRNLYLFIAILYRTTTEFEKKKAIFSDAIDRQINLLQTPQHPVWKIILLKQCCGLNSKYFNVKTAEYQWFHQTPFSHFCPTLHLHQDQIIKFEHTFRMKYSPQGLCLPLINDELKIELVLISIGLGFGILLMLLTWLFIWQNRLFYIELLKNMLQQQNKKSIVHTDKTSITSLIQQPIQFDVPETPVIVNVTTLETKQLYKGYLTPVEEMK